MYFVLNFVFFQVLWFSAVVGAGGNALHWLAIGALIPITVLTWFSPNRWGDYALAISSVAVGMLVDSMWVHLGILEYADSARAPYWIGCLWYGLGLTVNHSLSWFRDRAILGPLIVGAFAPVTYLTGERFGAVTVAALDQTVFISLSWVLIFVGLTRLSLWLREANMATYANAEKTSSSSS